MTTINIKSVHGEFELIKGLLPDGIREERKKIEYALNLSDDVIKKFEYKYGISSSSFLEKFKTGNIDENEETFQWWAETKLTDELREKLKALTEIEICQQ